MRLKNGSDKGWNVWNVLERLTYLHASFLYDLAYQVETTSSLAE